MEPFTNGINQRKIKDGIFTTFMDFDVRDGELDGAFVVGQTTSSILSLEMLFEGTFKKGALHGAAVANLSGGRFGLDDSMGDVALRMTEIYENGTLCSRLIYDDEDRLFETRFSVFDSYRGIIGQVFEEFLHHGKNLRKLSSYSANERGRGYPFIYLEEPVSTHYGGWPKDEKWVSCVQELKTAVEILSNCIYQKLISIGGAPTDRLKFEAEVRKFALSWVIYQSHISQNRFKPRLKEKIKLVLMTEELVQIMTDYEDFFRMETWLENYNNEIEYEILKTRGANEYGGLWCVLVKVFKAAYDTTDEPSLPSILLIQKEIATALQASKNSILAI